MMRITALVCCLLVVFAGCASGPIGNNPSETTPSHAGTDTDASTQQPSNGTLSVHVISVGQGAGVLIVSPTGETMLVDTGNYREDGEYVLSYLQKHDIQRIDYLVSTHPDADHIGGNARIIEYYETEANGVGAVYDPGIAASTRTYEEYLDAIERHDVTLYETHAGDPIPFEGVDVRVLGPPEQYLDNQDRNENSIVLQLSFGTTSFLLPGDAEHDAEQYLIERYGDELDSTVLAAGHHGSSSSSSNAFLDAVNPAAVSVSSAYDSRYGHPHNETLQRLASRSIPTYWTATHGNTVFVSDGETVTVKTQRTAPTAPMRLFDGSPIPPGSTDATEPRQTLGGAGTPVSTTADGTPSPVTSVATDGGQPSHALEVADVHADAEGPDETNLNDEYVVFENTGDEPIDLSEWSVSDEADHRYHFPDGFTLAPGERVTLRTGSGTDDNNTFYWDAGAPIWNNGGDTVIVLDANESRVTTEEYT